MRIIENMEELRIYAGNNPDEYVSVKTYTAKFTARASDAVYIVESLAKAEMEYPAEIREAWEI